MLEIFFTIILGKNKIACFQTVSQQDGKSSCVTKLCLFGQHEILGPIL